MYLSQKDKKTFIKDKEKKKMRFAQKIMEKRNRSNKNKSFIEQDGKSHRSYIDTFLTHNKSFEHQKISEMDMSINLFNTNKDNIRIVEELPNNIQMD